MTHYVVRFYRGGHKLSQHQYDSLLQAARLASRWVRDWGEGYQADVTLSADLLTCCHSRSYGQPGGIIKRVRHAPR